MFLSWDSIEVGRSAVRTETAPHQGRPMEQLVSTIGFRLYKDNVTDGGVEITYVPAAL